jgi:hypothetical protein
MMLTWDRPDLRSWRSGVSHGVVYPKNSPGVAWNGLISVNEAPKDSDVSVGYFDGLAYHQERSAEGFSGTIEALTYPDGFIEDISFGFSYRTIKDGSYELHLVYNTLLYSRSVDYGSLDASSEPDSLSWSFVTTPIQIPGLKATSHLVVDLNKAYSWVVSDLEDLIYGTDTVDPRLPTPGEVLDLFETGAIFRIVDNGDGSWTAIGPDSWITMLDSTTFEITSPSAIFIDADTYEISSW